MLLTASAQFGQLARKKGEVHILVLFAVKYVAFCGTIFMPSTRPFIITHDASKCATRVDEDYDPRTLLRLVTLRRFKGALPPTKCLTKFHVIITPVVPIILYPRFLQRGPLIRHILTDGHPAPRRGRPECHIPRFVSEDSVAHPCIAIPLLRNVGGTMEEMMGRRC